MRIYTILISVVSMLVMGAAAVWCGPLFSSDKMTHGGMGGPTFAATQLKNKGAFLVGGEGFWVINKALLVGGGGYAMVNNINASEMVASQNGKVHFGYGGLKVGMLMLSDNAISMSMGALLGAGGLAFNTDLSKLPDSSFFVVEPEVNVAVYLIDPVRLYFGAAYRLVSNLDVAGVSNSDLSGLSLRLSVQFGQF